MNTSIAKTGGRMLAKAKFVLNKRSPEIFLGAGIVAIVGGTIWACHVSRRLDATNDEFEYMREEIDYDYEEGQEALKMAKESEETTELPAVMTEKEYKHECTMLAFSRVGTYVKMYAPAVICIGGGIGMIVQGHRILCKRNAALLAAYTALDETFTEYRKRVKDRFGEDVEHDIYTGTTYEVALDEKGKPKKPKELVPVVGDSISPYSEVWDEGSTKEWMKSMDYNYTFLLCQQNAANNKLWFDGYLLLNTVRKMLGLKENPTGAICGWILPEGADKENGDDFVDFGCFLKDGGLDASKFTADGGILLDFNCQGVIYDKI